MNLLLYIAIGPVIPSRYENSIIEKAKIHLPGITVYDCDNHSETLTIRYAADLLAQAARAVAIIQVNEDKTAADGPVLGGLRLLFERLLQQPDKLLVLLHGEHPLTERIMSLLPPGRLHKNQSETQQLASMDAFLTE